MMQGKVFIGINLEKLPSNPGNFTWKTEVHYSSESIFFSFGFCFI